MIIFCFQGPPVSGFYQNRSGNFRSTHNRNFGNFDSMGHPKHYGNAGGGYQHPQGGIHPYNANYNRQVYNDVFYVKNITFKIN